MFVRMLVQQHVRLLVCVVEVQTGFDFYGTDFGDKLNLKLGYELDCQSPDRLSSFFVSVSGKIR